MSEYKYIETTPQGLAELEKIKAEFLLERARIFAKNERDLRDFLGFCLGALWCWILFYLGVFNV